MGGRIKGRLSVVILAKNEERRISKFLECMAGWCDEIVVVDDYSTDNTANICKEAGCKVVARHSNLDFSTQRNFGADAAAGEWIFVSAPDEYISEEAKRKIEQALNDNNGIVAFQLLRKNFFLGHPIEHCGASNWDTRIYKKGLAHFEGTPHEKLIVKGNTGKIDAEIFHYAFDSISQVIATGNFYTDIESDEFVRKIDKISYKEIKYNLTWKSLKLFWKLYVKKKGYKDGQYGFMWCVLNVMGPQMRWLKIWEKAKREGKLK
jgi:glycosyltransferase involved in cell wall biosynthesis